MRRQVALLIEHVLLKLETGIPLQDGSDRLFLHVKKLTLKSKRMLKFVINVSNNLHPFLRM